MKFSKNDKNELYFTGHCMKNKKNDLSFVEIIQFPWLNLSDNFSLRTWSKATCIN